MMKILPDSHPLLHTATIECSRDFILNESQDIAHDMLATMRSNGGIGLAANQVGLPHRMFVMRNELGEDLVFLNPVILDSGPDILMNEGCLTYPGLFLPIKRPSWVTIEALDTKGETFGGVLLGIDARCFLHEIDHLDGIVMTSRVSRLKLSMARKKALKSS